jgi:uncharacterized protein (DUF58 family)
VLTAAYGAVLDAVRGIAWPALRRARSAVPGPHPSTVRGTTAEFVEYRGYRQGDDPKRIDWKLVARTDRVYIRLSQERTILPTMVLVDASASMAFPVDTKAKWEMACQLAIALAAIARHGGDPVGLAVAHAGGRSFVAPRTRRSVLEEMMQALSVEPTGDAPLTPTMTDAIRRSARVAVVSDFLGDTEDLIAAGRHFVAAGGEMYAIHVVDPLELDPDPKRLLLTDPENPAIRRPMSREARAAYTRRFAAWRAQLAHDWRLAGAVYAMVVPGTESLRHLVRRITTPPRSGRVGR